MRFNLVRAHGGPSQYQYAQRGCRCPWCLSRASQYHALNHLARREKRMTYNRERLAAVPPEERKAADRERYLRERERRVTYQRRYYAEHRDECIARARRRKAVVVGSHTKADVQAQFERQKGRCYWCGAKMKGRRGRDTWHADHIVPIAKGGTDWPENIVCACAGCNHHKSDAHPMDYAGRMF